MDLFDELSEADAFLGVSDYKKINKVIERIYSGERVNAVGKPREECGKSRVLTTNSHAYLKIADGCSNHCTYCLIPYIRGKYRSVPLKLTINSVQSLRHAKMFIRIIRRREGAKAVSNFVRTDYISVYTAKEESFKVFKKVFAKKGTRDYSDD